MIPRKFITLFGALLLLTVLSVPCGAQTVDDRGFWTAWLTQGKISTDPCSQCQGWKWWFDGHLRFFDDTNGFGQSIVRPGVGYAIAENMTLWAGYAWIHNSPAARPAFDENRIWQQLTGSKQLGCLKFGARSRLEQRWVELGDDTGLRFRQFFSLRRPLPNNPQLLLVGWDEMFFHLNDTDWGARGGFDQNRVFVGLGIKSNCNRKWRTEIGYLHQFINRPTAADRSNHILAVNFFRAP